MRTLINYLRSCFCKHEFIGEISAYESKFSSRPYAIRRTYMCKKCGYVKKIKLQFS